MYVIEPFSTAPLERSPPLVPMYITPLVLASNFACDTALSTDIRQDASFAACGMFVRRSIVVHLAAAADSFTATFTVTTFPYRAHE